MRSSCRRGGIIIAVVASKVDVSVVEHVSTMCKVSRANVEQWKHSPGTAESCIRLLRFIDYSHELPCV